MIIVCTNIWNHHLGPVCQELARQLGGDFRMLLSRPLQSPESIARVKNGWKLVPPDEPWIVGPPVADSDWETGPYNELIREAEVAIIGSTFARAWSAIRRRVRAGKLTFFMNERFFKNPRRWFDWLNPRRLLSWYRLHRLLSPVNVHYLTMNHWCADDLAFLHACTGRTWRWGYLVAVSDAPTPKPVREKVHIGWCGRFLYLKNACDILQAAASLKNTIKNQIEITFVGEGPEKESLVRLAHELGLDDKVRFFPFMPAQDVRAFMRDLDIYVFPSGRQEGWGAVLGEAMDASCAVIANEAAGSTLELVKNGANGFTYRDGDIATLSRRLGELVENAALRKEFGLAAWRTMQNWSPAEGAKRLISLIEQVSRNEPPRMTDGGLCSLRG